MTGRPDEVPGLPVRGRAYYIERVGLSPHEQQVIDDLDRRVILLDPAFAARFATTSSPHRRRGWWPFRR